MAAHCLGCSALSAISRLTRCHRPNPRLQLSHPPGRSILARAGMFCGTSPPKNLHSAIFLIIFALSGPSPRCTSAPSAPTHMMVGSARMQSSDDSAAFSGLSSQSILRTRTRPRSWAETRSSCGASTLHGPHLAAQKAKIAGLPPFVIASCQGHTQRGRLLHMQVRIEPGKPAGFLGEVMGSDVGRCSAGVHVP